MNDATRPSGSRAARAEAPRKAAVDEQAAGATRASREDLALVGRLVAGDEKAFAALVDQYHARLLRLALTFVSDRDAAEEVVQDTWMGVLNGLPGFEGRCALKSWIFRILANRAKTRGVRDARSMSFSAFVEQDEDPQASIDSARFQASGMWADPPGPWDEDAVQQSLERQEALQRVQEEIARLPPNQRAVLTLRDVEGVDSIEVCNILGIAETNQRVLLHRARTKVRRALEAYLRGK
jgi:RNA polymerase sigma-70 factor, ECF subfamily